MPAERAVQYTEVPSYLKPRSENPLVFPLEYGPDRLMSFTGTVNAILQEYGTSGIAAPRIEMAWRGGQAAPFVVVEIPYEQMAEAQISSLKQVLVDLHETETLAEGIFFAIPSETEGMISRMKHRVIVPQEYYYLSASNFSPQLRDNPYKRDGIFLEGQKHKPVTGMKRVFDAKRSNTVPQKGTLEIHDSGFYSEVELAYITIVHALIAGGKLDVSTPQRLEETLPQRRKILIDVYHRMISEMVPTVAYEELFGLEKQLADLKNNLYEPLRSKSGTPMNTLLLGAPGVGKSALTYTFATYEDVVTVYLPADILSKTLQNGQQLFKDRMLPRLTRLKRVFDIPMVVCLDDAESIFQSTIGGGRQPQPGSGTVSPEKRAQVLSLLERLEDTYRIFLIVTLNNPDIEPAFLRRFNPIYFPLPDKARRELFLRAIISPGELEADHYDDLIVDLTRRTSHFNYSGIARIPEYLGNLPSLNGSVPYKEYVDTALSKARQRTDSTMLKQSDEDARALLHLLKRTHLGFRTPQHEEEEY